MHDHEWDNPELAADIERDHPPLTPHEQLVIQTYDLLLDRLGLSHDRVSAILEKAGR
jgi:hypothetical protein